MKDSFEYQYWRDNWKDILDILYEILMSAINKNVSTMKRNRAKVNYYITNDEFYLFVYQHSLKTIRGQRV